MRPLSFRPDDLRALLQRNKIATLEKLKQALGTPVDVTVFRKLKPLDYLTSYSHRGRYYTLREIARFDDRGLWSQADAWFSRFGTLLATAEGFVNRSPRGYLADELAPVLHVQVQDALHQLTQQGRVARQLVSARYLYTAVDPSVQRRQLLARRTVELLPTIMDASVLEVSPEEAKAAILLFYSLLDEQQRRLYAGLESLKLGRGGDRQLADFLDLDPHTVARGRQQLLSQDVEVDRARSIATWWKREGARRWGRAPRLLVLADSGGSNGCTSWAWKTEIQTQVCNPFGLAVTIAHYPTGASKWNPIEHRLFSEISKNWAAEPLDSYEKMLKFIRTTSTKTGLVVTAYLDRNEYQTHLKPDPQLISSLRFTPDKVIQ